MNDVAPPANQLAGLPAVEEPMEGGPMAEDASPHRQRCERTDELVRPYGLTYDQGARTSEALERLIVTRAWAQTVAEEELAGTLRELRRYVDEAEEVAVARRWGTFAVPPSRLISQLTEHLTTIRTEQSVIESLGIALAVQRRREGIAA